MLEGKGNEISDRMDKFLFGVALRRAMEGSVATKQHIVLAYTYGIYVTKDYKQPYGLEIGLMDEFRYVRGSLCYVCDYDSYIGVLLQ